MVPLPVYQCFYIAHYWVVAKVYMYKVLYNNIIM